MRSFALVLTLCAGCHDRTEIIVGVATDLRAKGEIDEVRLTASRQGIAIVRTDWQLVDVPAGQYELPGSFGLYSADGSETAIEISAKGYLKNNLVADREVQLSLVADKTLFLRMTLTSQCSPGAAPKCPADQNCVEGACQPKLIDAHRLPAYRSELVTKTECTSSVQYLVSSTGVAMDKLGDVCPPGNECHEGTCWKPPPGVTPPACLTIDAGLPDGGESIVTTTDLRVSDFPIFVAQICGQHFYPDEITLNVGDSLSFIDGDGNSHHIMSPAVTTPDIMSGAASITFSTAGDATVVCTDHPADGQLLVHAIP